MRAPAFVVLLTLLAFGVGPSAAQAELAPEPSTEHPDGLLRVRPENAEMFAATQAAWQRAATPIKNIATKRAQGQVGNISPKEVGEAQIATVQFRRLAERLALIGEPVGIELGHRAGDFTGELTAAVKAFKDIPGNREKVAAAYRDGFVPAAQKASGKLNAIGKLAQQGKWETAEKEFFELYEPLEAMAIWYDANELTQPLMPFGAAYKAIYDQMLTQRRAEAEKLLGDARKAALPDMAALVRQTQDAATTIAASGRASLDGQALTGPAALTLLVKKWQEVYLAALRARALAWALQHVTSRGVADLAPLEDSFNQAARGMPAALAGLIDADAKRTPPAEVAALYAAYVAALVPLADLSANGALVTAAEPALARLADRSPEFAAQLASYRRATSDLLRWRRRVAKQAADRASKPNYLPLEVRFLEAARASNEFPGIVSSGLGTTKNAHIQVSMPRAMPGLTKMVGTEVAISDGLASAAAKAQGRYQDRIYPVYAPPVAALAPYVPLLEFDLLVSPAAPPMTMEAALAIHRMKRGDVVAAGGKVTRLKLMGFIPYFSAPAKEVALPNLGPLRLGALPNEPVPPDPAEQLLAECEIKPAWVQHELMFVPVP